MATEVALDFYQRRISASPASAWTGFHTSLLTDTLYAVADTAIVPRFSGAAMTGVFRTRKIVVDTQLSFAWLRLEGPFTAAVVRVYVDGVLKHTTPSLTSDLPVRLPAVRGREWEFEIESDDRITALHVTGAASELP